MKLTICTLGIHDWKIVQLAEYENNKMQRLAIPSHRKRRVCKACGKTQEQEVHCLGLHGEAKYTRHWENVSKIEYDDNGKVDIIVDGAGALIVCDETTNMCYGLAPYGSTLGPLNKQGNCIILGKYALSYPT